MKYCLSIQQPWAWAIFHGGKDVENRSWSSGYYGRLLIHASKRYDQEGHDWIRAHFPDLFIPALLPMGAIVGQVRMMGCVRPHSSKWYADQWAFVFENPEEFVKPITWRGELGIFTIVSHLDLEVKK